MTRRNKPLRTLLSRLRRDQRGGVALTFLVSTTVMLGGSFGAIDLIRYNVAQNRLQNSLDAAAISAGRNLANRTPTPGTPDAEAWVNDARNFFSSNMPDSYMGSSVQQDDLQINYREERSGAYITGQFVEMSAVGDLPLISTGFLKVTSFGLAASNEAVRRTRNDLEVVLALDNSGSMDYESPTRMSVLKQASLELVETVLGAASVPGGSQSIYIGLVPFSDVVNVGNTSYTRDWLSFPIVQQNFINNRWAGCIVEPKGNWTSSNRLPAAVLSPAAGFQAMHLTRSQVFNANLLSRTRIAPNDAQLQPRIFNRNTSSSIQYDRRVHAERESDTQFRVNMAMEPSGCVAGRRASFLNKDQATMEAAINGMSSNGSTIVPAGLLWAWRMLHPAWRGAWDGSEMPRDPEPKVLSKVIVLLTDGENSPGGMSKSANSPRRGEAILTYDYNECRTWNSSRNRCDAWRTDKVSRTTGTLTINTEFNQSPVNALKMFDPITRSTSSNIGWGGTGVTTMNTAAVNSYMATLCSNVKEDGNDIKIYAVTLGADVGTNARNLMRNCSSGPTYYYNAQNVDDLPQVFASIAGALTELRLTK